MCEKFEVSETQMVWGGDQYLTEQRIRDISTLSPIIKNYLKSLTKFCAQMRRAHPMVNGITSKSIVNFLPNMLIIVPIKRHMTAAPNVVDDPTQDHASSFTEKLYSLLKSVSFGLSTIRISVGDVHPKRVPAARAPPVAKRL